MGYPPHTPRFCTPSASSGLHSSVFPPCWAPALPSPLFLLSFHFP